MKPSSLQELYVEQLRDLYDAEQQIIKALLRSRSTLRPRIRRNIFVVVAEIR